MNGESPGRQTICIEPCGISNATPPWDSRPQRDVSQSDLDSATRYKRQALNSRGGEVESLVVLDVDRAVIIEPLRWLASMPTSSNPFGPGWIRVSRKWPLGVMTEEFKRAIVSGRVT